MFLGSMNASEVSICVYYVRIKSYDLKAQIGDFLNEKFVILQMAG